MTPSWGCTLPPVPGRRCPRGWHWSWLSLPAYAYCLLPSRTSVPFNFALSYFLSEYEGEARRTWNGSAGPFGEVARVWPPLGAPCNKAVGDVDRLWGQTSTQSVLNKGSFRSLSSSVVWHTSDFSPRVWVCHFWLRALLPFLSSFLFSPHLQLPRRFWCFIEYTPSHQPSFS